MKRLAWLAGGLLALGLMACQPIDQPAPCDSEHPTTPMCAQLAEKISQKELDNQPAEGYNNNMNKPQILSAIAAAAAISIGGLAASPASAARLGEGFGIVWCDAEQPGCGDVKPGQRLDLVLPVGTTAAAARAYCADAGSTDAPYAVFGLQICPDVDF